MFYGVVYKITCEETCKSYIGRTKRSLRKRWHDHCHAASNCVYLKRAIKRYGKESFTIKAIASSWNAEDIKELEALLIEQENTLAPHGYNLINTRNGVTDISEETRAKKSIPRRRKDAITFNGETHPLSTWAKKLGLSKTNLKWRIENWGIEEAFATGHGQAHGSARQAAGSLKKYGITFNGETHSLSGWCKKIGMKHPHSLKRRIEKYDIQKALTMSIQQVQSESGKAGQLNRFGGLTCSGITDSIVGWADRIGISLHALQNRLSRWDTERALLTPKLSKETGWGERYNHK